jgi:hypothetical protein
MPFVTISQCSELMMARLKAQPSIRIVDAELFVSEYISERISLYLVLSKYEIQGGLVHHVSVILREEPELNHQFILQVERDEPKQTTFIF